MIFLFYMFAGWLAVIQANQECHQLALHMAKSGAAAFKTIGQLNDRLLLVTVDGQVYNVSSVNIDESHLYLKDAIGEKMKVKWPTFFSVNPQSFLVNGTFVTLQINSTKGTLLVGTLHSKNNSALSSTLCDPDSNECQKIADYQLPSQIADNFAFINSYIEGAFFVLNSENYSITKYTIVGAKIAQSGPTRYLGLVENADKLTQLLVTDHRSGQVLSYDFILANPLKGFTGFATHQNTYLFGKKKVYIFDSSALTHQNFPFIVNITKVPLKSFISCEEKPISVNGGEYSRQLDSIISLASIFMFFFF